MSFLEIETHCWSRFSGFLKKSSPFAHHCNFPGGSMVSIIRKRFTMAMAHDMESNYMI
jgi:hypothetical protein